jgi:thiamine-phosphate diphosphorylase
MVTDRARIGEPWPSALPAAVARAARAGVHIIQLREPGLDAGRLAALTRACIDAVAGTPARVVVNDRLDVALAAGAHGVHLRGDSMPEARVRRLAPRPFLVGRSIHSEAEAEQAGSDLDYLVFGTVYTTASKPGRPPAGLEALARAVRATPLPVLAIGGITVAAISDVMATGAAGVAAISLFADV